MKKNKSKKWKWKNKKNKPRLPMSEFFVSRSDNSKVQELKIGKDIGGRRVPGSGRIIGLRGDAENSKFLVEAKQTKYPHFFLSEKILKRIDKEAFSDHKMPAVVIEFLNMPFGLERSWAAIPYSIMKSCLNEDNLYILETARFKTKRTRIKIQMKDLEATERPAVSTGKIPAIFLEYLWMQGGVEQKWALIPYPVFVKMANPQSPVKHEETEEEE